MMRRDPISEAEYREQIRANGTPTKRLRSGTPPPATPPPSADQVPPSGWEIIRDYLLERYRPAYRSGESAYSTTEHREVRRVEACAALPPDLIPLLAAAGNAPQFKGGGVNVEALPGFFKKWSGTGWSALLATLADEDAAVLGTIGDARELFRRLVRDAMYTEVTIAFDVKDERGRVEQRVERRSLIGWCSAFAKPGPWRAIRSKQCWTRLLELGGGEVEIRIAIRHGLFAQLRADRRLCEMTSNTFTRRAERYGVGKPGGQSDRAHGQWVLVIDDEFVREMLSGVPEDDGICTDSKSANDSRGGVQLSDTDNQTQPSPDQGVG